MKISKIFMMKISRIFMTKISKIYNVVFFRALYSSSMLHSVDWQFDTDVSAQSTGPILRIKKFDDKFV